MSFSSVHPAYDIYAHQLWSLGHGHAMWGPDPSPAFGEVRLGDVGYLREGHFSSLFNCMRDAHDPVNKRGVPPDFTVFTPPDLNSIQFCPDKITQSELHSKSIRSLAVSVGASVSEAVTSATAAATLRYQCMQTSGALLLLKDNAHKWFLDCDRHIKTYMAANIEQWHDFATMRLGIDVKQEDIIFVSGCTKTSVWAEAAFHGTSSQGELVVSGGWPAPVSGEFRVSLSRSADASVFSRTGPSHRVKKDKNVETVVIESGSETSIADQCIFLNYHKAKQRKRWRPPKVIKAAAGPHDPDCGSSGGDDSFASLISALGSPSSSDSESSSTTSSTSSESGLSYNSFSPVDSLIDYIFMNSDAETACVSDTELNRIFPGEDLPDDILFGLESLQIPITMGKRYAEVNPQYIPEDVVANIVQRYLLHCKESPVPQSLVEVSPASNHKHSPAISVDSYEGTLVDVELSDAPSYPMPSFQSGSETKKQLLWAEMDPAVDDVIPPLSQNTDMPLIPEENSSCWVPSKSWEWPSDEAGQALLGPDDQFESGGRLNGALDANISEDEDVTMASTDAQPSKSTQERLDAIQARRRQNTLAARRSRKRKMDYQRELEAAVEREKEEKGMWKQRALEFKTMLEGNGTLEQQKELEAAVERERMEKEMWQQRAMHFRTLLESHGLTHEGLPPSVPPSCQ